MRRLLFVVLLIFCLCFSACGQKKADFSDILTGPLEAELTGEACGIAFEGKLVVAACGEAGIAPATLTFYAPRELAGTQLIRDETGAVTLSYDGVSLGDAHGVGIVLLSLFPGAEQVKHVALNEAGNTVVLFEGAEIEFSESGVPLRVKTADVTAQILSWNKP